MKKTLELLLCVCMLIGLLAGCGGGSAPSGGSNDSGSSSSGGSGSSEPAPAEAVKVAYLTPSLDVPFWRYMRHGVEDELGKVGIECVTYDSKDDANTQMSNAQDAITKQVDAIVISPTDSASCVSVLSLAEESGVPVVICDIGTDSGEYVSFISTDNLSGGKAIGEYIASQLEPGTEVAQIALNQARINGVLRKDGFDEGIAGRFGMEFGDASHVQTRLGNEPIAFGGIMPSFDFRAVTLRSGIPKDFAAMTGDRIGRTELPEVDLKRARRFGGEALVKDAVVHAVQQGQIA